MVAEGRRLLRNLQRVAKLFVTKSIFASVMILSVGLAAIAYPLLPRHPDARSKPDDRDPCLLPGARAGAGTFHSTSFLRDVARPAVPAGTAAALGVLAGYFYTERSGRHPDRGTDRRHDHARCDRSLSRRRTRGAGTNTGTAVSGLVTLLAGGYFLVLAHSSHARAVRACGRLRDAARRRARCGVRRHRSRLDFRRVRARTPPGSVVLSRSDRRFRRCPFQARRGC